MTPQPLWRRLLDRGGGFGLAGRTTFWTIVLGALMAGTIGIYMYRSSVDIITEREQGSLAESVNAATNRLSARIEIALQDVLMLAKMPPVRRLIAAGAAAGGTDPVEGAGEAQWRDRFAEIFTALMEARLDYFQARLIGLADGGREIVRVDRTLAGEIVRAPDASLQAKGDRPYFRETVKLLHGQVYVSDVDLNEEAGKIEEPHRPVVRVATPVFGPSNELFGIAILSIEMTRLFAIVDQMLGPGHITLITNEAGDYLAAPDAGKTFGFDLGKRYRLQDDLPEFAPIYAGSRQSFAGNVEMGSKPYLAFALRLHFDPARPDRHLVVVSLLSSDALLASIRARRDALLIIATGLILAGVAFAIVMAGAVARPLRQLAAAATGLAEGRHDIDVGGLTLRRDETGDLARAVSVMIRQIGEREDRLVAQARELVRSNQELAQFAYIASHDLQEPLRMIGSYLELLSRRYGDRLDGEAGEFIRFAVDGAARMKRLINDLLGYSRAGSNPLRVEAVDTGATVAAVLTTLAPQIDELGATVEVGPLPTVRADAIQLERLFLNLIENALKYRSKAPPRIRVSAEPVGGGWQFSVADNGIGIDPRFKDKVFEIFKRLHGRDDYSGTGIGLAVAKLVVERHGGHIRVEPAPGGGSVFIFTLAA